MARHNYPTSFGFDPNADPNTLVTPDIVGFFETNLTFTKGARAGTNVSLLLWQKRILRELFRAKRCKRLHRRALVGMPRKNGKSFLGAGIALYGLVGEGEQGAEVYSAAGTRDQARIVFNEAKRMAELSPSLSKVIKPYRSELVVPKTGSIYRALAAEAYSSEGLNPSTVVFDEVHVQPDHDLWNVLTLGSGARANPLVLGITTAGFDKDSLCHELYAYGKQVQSGEITDPSFYFLWLEPADPKCDWRDEKVWKECNPGLKSGFLDIEDFRTAAKQTGEAAFRRYRLNQWTATQEAWLPHGAWDACFSPTQIQPGQEVVLGFDGSHAGDSTALIVCTLGGHVQVVNLWEKPPNDKEWRVPIADTEDAIRAACRGWKVVEVAADPYMYMPSIQKLEAERLPMVEYPNVVPRMVAATAKLEDAIQNGKLTHDGDPRLARHVANCVVRTDAKGSRITKDSKNSSRKIDAAVAMLMAYDRATQVRPTRSKLFVV